MKFVTNTPRPGETAQQIADRYWGAHQRVSPPEHDAINLPPHYARYKIEPTRFIAENKLDWFQGNIIKYVVRHGDKNGIEDLKKAQRYLAMYIDFIQGDEDFWKVRT